MPYRSPQAFYREFWALRDVSFEVRRGEAVGIIGRNGAGKSTLLQIVAGTLAPTAGDIVVHGRVAAMLELGSGFNPEFTGRENVHLSAAVLGFSPDEVREKFDAIASFADIGDFMDQPVKTYSSGMVVRLAFSVQAAVEPEILIVDEALSVGDVFFQAKCMARLRKLIDDGVTLLFVSHDTSAVKQICSRALLLDRGTMQMFGDTGKVTDKYLQMEMHERNQASTSPEIVVTSTPFPTAVSRASPTSTDYTRSLEGSLAIGQSHFASRAAFERVGNGEAEFLNVQMLRDGEIADVFQYNEQVVLRQIVRFNCNTNNVNVSYKIRTPQGIDIVFGDARLQGQMQHSYHAGHIYVFEWIFRLPLLHGSYCIRSGLSHPPARPGEDWTFLDVVPLSYDFRVMPRSEGMIDGYVTWEDELRIHTLSSAGRMLEQVRA